MIVSMEWANQKPLVEDINYFILSARIFELDKQKLKRFDKPPLLLANAIHWSRRFEYPWAILKTKFPGGERCLDAGGGCSSFQFLLAELYKDVYNIDPFNDSNDVLSYDDLMKIVNPNLHLVRGSLPHIDYPDNFFNDSFCISVLEHMDKKDIVRSIEELLRVTSERVMITMDVCEASLTRWSFMEIMEELKIIVKEPGPDCLVGRLPDTGDIRIACLFFEKGL